MRLSIIVNRTCCSHCFTDSSHIVDNHLKLILGLIWTLILHYSISMPVWEDDEPGGPKESTPKQRLLAWVQNKVPDQPIKNFTTDWNDGRAIGALVDSIAPGDDVIIATAASDLDIYDVWRHCV